MVKITYQNRARHITVDVRGHAGNAPKGEDVVCAGVSTLTVTLADALSRVYAPGFKAVMDDGAAHIECRENKQTRPIVQTIFRGFDMLAASYPDEVQIIIG